MAVLEQIAVTPSPVLFEGAAGPWHLGRTIGLPVGFAVLITVAWEAFLPHGEDFAGATASAFRGVAGIVR